MAGGGTWTVQNKIRPGAYINFVSVPAPLGIFGTRGIVAVALPMTWGPIDSLIELYGTDLLNGLSLAKIGYTAANVAESLPYRLALAGCYKALLWRSDAGGVNATVVVNTALTITAKYPGTTGNELSVVILADTPVASTFTIQVLFGGVVKESFTALIITELEDLTSEYVNFIVAVGHEADAIPATAGSTLVNGTNGSVSETYTDFFTLVTTEQWQCMAIQSDDAGVPAQVKAKILSLRDSLGKKVQGVVYNSVASDYEGIISVKQGFTTPTDTVTVELFQLWVASITAGAAVNQSNTSFVVPGATVITGYISDEDVEDELAAGWFLLGYRQDGAVIVEQDINGLVTYTVDKGSVFRKNRVIRCLDEIGNSISLIFTTNYSGKTDNTAIGRNIFKSEIIAFIDTLVNLGAVTNFAGPDDITVLPGAEVDSVVVDLTIQPADSMEKLYMTVNVSV